ncbi:hypothetical protein [Rhodovulum sulfidophilum]|uniref:hypothetical protein n=1 Tax=Rhodovulum sulfidophilum TaxID=35806 RepID=UPI002115D5F8|nr:hypothetical protein [Rhodovulum sulfidophilum]
MAGASFGFLVGFFAFDMLLNGSRTAFACLVEPLMDMLGLLGVDGRKRTCRGRKARSGDPRIEGPEGEIQCECRRDPDRVEAGRRADENAAGTVKIDSQSVAVENISAGICLKPKKPPDRNMLKAICPSILRRR